MNVIEYALDARWALHRPTFERMLQVLQRHARGIRLEGGDLDQVRAQAGDKRRARRAPFRVQGGVAIVPIHGIISRHAGLIEDMSPGRGTSVDSIRRGLRGALEAEDADAILLDVESPGGAAAGMADLADEILAARQRKPIVAHSGDLIASGAYWLGSQANRLLVGQQADVGSIGVIAALVDDTRLLENEGVDITIAKTGPRKGADSRGRVSDELRQAVQEDVDAIGELFVAAVARGRAIRREVADELADGDVHIGQRAVELGLADEVATFQEAFDLAQRLAGRVLGDGLGEESGEDTPVEMPAARKFREDDMDEKRSEDRGAEGKEGDPVIVEGGDLVIDGIKISTPHAESIARIWPDAAEELRIEGAQRERDRIANIRELSDEGQEELVEKLIKDGTSEDDAARELLRDLRGQKAGRLARLREHHEQVDAEDLDDEDGKVFVESGQEDEDELEAAAKTDWERNRRVKEGTETFRVREQFSSFGNYLEYCRNMGAPQRA